MSDSTYYVEYQRTSIPGLPVRWILYLGTKEIDSNPVESLPVAYAQAKQKRNVHKQKTEENQIFYKRLLLT